jgi:hypothetical protein
VSAGPANYPTLTKTNYNQWALLMKIKLEARGLWGAVDPGDAEFQVDRMALDAICSTVPLEMVTTLEGHGNGGVGKHQNDANW